MHFEAGFCPRHSEVNWFLCINFRVICCTVCIYHSMYIPYKEFLLSWNFLCEFVLHLEWSSNKTENRPLPSWRHITVRATVLLCVTMWQLQSADQTSVCRPINIKKSGRPTVGFNVTNQNKWREIRFCVWDDRPLSKWFTMISFLCSCFAARTIGATYLGIFTLANNFFRWTYFGPDEAHTPMNDTRLHDVTRKRRHR